MASLFRPQYTYKGKLCRSKTWYGQYRDHTGKTVRVSLGTTNKSAAQLKLADLVRAADEGRDSSTYRQARKTPIGEHVDAWLRHLELQPATVRWRRVVLYRVRRIVDGCAWKTLDDLGAESAAACLGRLQEDGKTRREANPGISAKTRNGYVNVLRRFGAWLESTRRLPANPFAELGYLSTDADRRRDRRAFTEAELARLLQVTRESDVTFQGLDGRARHALYLTAAGTGFRAGELAALTPASFALDATPPVVRLPAAKAKNRKRTEQPIPAAIVPVLREYLAGRPASERAWPGTWPHDTAEMLQVDLAAAGIPYVVQGPDGPVYADFHSLRHTFVSLLDRPDVSFKEAMELARHSDPRLTAKIYGKATLQRVAAAADRSCGNLAQPFVQEPAQARPDAAKADAPTVLSFPGRGEKGQGETIREGESQGEQAGVGTMPTLDGFFFVHADILVRLLALALAAAEVQGEERRAA